MKQSSMFCASIIVFMSIQIFVSQAQAGKIPNRLVSSIQTPLNSLEVKLLGIAMHQEKGHDVYIASLYVDKEKNGGVEQLEAHNMAKKMSLKFVSGYSRRKIQTYWKQRIVADNLKESWQPLMRDIIRFSKIFEQRLTVGDHVEIDFRPGEGTFVYLNKALFINIKSEMFFSLLLNVWLGDIGPANSFRIAIKGGSAPTASLKRLSRLM